MQETVAALLETTKQLQDCLRTWSIGKASDEQVSDVYVDVGTKFNATVTAFMSLGIDLSWVSTACLDPLGDAQPSFVE